MERSDHSNAHIPVLLNQVLSVLDLKAGDVVIDCTLGTGGHSQAILEKIGPTGWLSGIETDDRNLNIARDRLHMYANCEYIHANFRNLLHVADPLLKKLGRVDCILFDLGLSSLHVDESKRGFSFQRLGPLDMRFDTRQSSTAADIINEYSEKDLANIFILYSQEPYAYRIARKIVQTRRQRQLQQTTELADTIRSCVPHSFRKVHPSIPRIFQALRIAVNDELEALHEGLTAAIQIVSSGGRIAVISYHSGEDRIAKNIFRQAKKENLISLLTKKPIIPDEREINENPRARSAKLRAAIKR